MSAVRSAKEGSKRRSLVALGCCLPCLLLCNPLLWKPWGGPHSIPADSSSRMSWLPDLRPIERKPAARYSQSSFFSLQPTSFFQQFHLLENAGNLIPFPASRNVDVSRFVLDCSSKRKFIRRKPQYVHLSFVSAYSSLSLVLDLEQVLNS